MNSWFKPDRRSVVAVIAVLFSLFVLCREIMPVWAVIEPVLDAPKRLDSMDADFAKVEIELRRLSERIDRMFEMLHRSEALLKK